MRQGDGEQSDKRDRPTAKPPSADPLHERKNRARRVVLAPAHDDFEAFDSLLAQEFVSRSEARPTVHGRDAYKQYMKQHRVAFPDFDVDIEEIIAEEQRVVVRWTARGTHEKAFFGIGPTHRRVEWTGVSIFRFRQDRIVEQWVQTDVLNFLRQLGALKEPMRSIQ